MKLYTKVNVNFFYTCDFLKVVCILIEMIVMEIENCKWGT